MRNLRGGNDVKVVIPPTATAAENDTTSRAAAAPAAASPTEAAPDVRAIGGTQGTDILININTAGTEELKSLPGIGEKRAEDIIAYRNANGAFPDIYAIKDVPGIGDGIFEQLADKITV
ncbi:MAG: helix-hairpin-helix domain-containing protein [Clostridia bacterium]|nr:helix-hairpin-helix domain-containing protein [Clostridia bacterium]